MKSIPLSTRWEHNFLENQLLALTRKLSECEKWEGQIKDHLREIEKISISLFGRKGSDPLPAVSMVDEEVNVRLFERCTELVSSLQRAVRLIETDPDSYGICEKCEREIGLKRLAASPWAPFCIKCQREIDE